MSCAGKGYGTNPTSNQHLISQFYGSVALNPNYKTSRKCRKFNDFLPSFTPRLDNLSVTSSSAGVYSLVYVNGSNFLPNGTTTVQFGILGYVPTTYYSSFTLSFVVPLNAVVGDYPVTVVNIYNGNFSPQVNQSYPGNINVSTPIEYTIL